MPETVSPKQILDQATSRGHQALSEYDAKRLLAACGIGVTVEELAQSDEAVVAAAQRLGYPVAVKACSPALLHKSDQGLLRLNLGTPEAVRAAANEIREALAGMPVDGLLVQRMVRGKREVIVGGLRDPLFGPCVMLGIGGIAVEALGDVSFRLAPLDERDALEMLGELRGHPLFEDFRGEPPVDKAALSGVLCAVGRLLEEQPQIAQVDINPLIFEADQPVAVDALITFEPAERNAGAVAPPRERRTQHFEALFEPESVAIVGASDSPLKWGFRILYNTIEGGYTGRLYGVNPKHTEIMGVPCFPSIPALPEAPELVLIVVPPPAVAPALRACAAKGVRAAIVITAGYAELDDDGARAAQLEIAAIADETGLLVVGPNCAGLASPGPKNLYCGMISRFPQAGGLSIASQSGNVGSTVLTWAALHQVGIGRFVSSGNEAATCTEDYLDYLARDPRTQSILSYVEGTRSGRSLFESLRKAAAQKPVVLIKGGRSQAGMRAAQSHTGSLATETRLFEAACRQAGATVINDTYEAMEVCGVFLNQPLPKGRRVVIVSQGGGWGVVTADACAEAGLDVIPLPAETLAELDSYMPGWWSRNNPIDLVAGNDIHMLSRVIETVIKHPEVDAVIMLGIGYISSASNRFQESETAVKVGLDKLAAVGAEMEIEDVHRIAGLIEKYGKTILIASDTVLLAYGPQPNQAIAELERLGIYAFSSPGHVARTLAHLAARHEYLHRIPRRGNTA